MLAFKVFGSFLIVASGFAFSRILEAADDEKIRTTDALLELVGAVRSRIDSFCMPISEILGDIDPNILIRCGYPPENIPSDLESMNSLCPFSADCELFRIFEDYFGNIGSGYKSEELARCAITIEELKALAARRREERKRKKKTIPVLCTCIAAGIAVVLF